MKIDKTMEKSNSKAEFDSVEFEKRLSNLKDTQESIQALSAWCLQNKSHHKLIVTSWLVVLKQVKVEHRLTLFYLANDVIQYSKRKHYEFVDSWGTALQRATTMVRDEKVKQKIERILKIWEQRGIYNEEFLTDLHGLLSINPAKKPLINDGDDEQAAITVANIKNCLKLEKETDRSFKALPKAPLCDKETLSLLKDRNRVDDMEREVIDRRAKLEHYIKTLTNEIKARSTLISVLDQADAFYHNQRGEVKVVATAYRNFGNRIKTMKRKVDELVKTLPSPIPSPDINAPSPGPADNDFVLPGEGNFEKKAFKLQSNGMTSGYMDGGRLPFDINDFSNASPKGAEAHIQVINSSSGKDNENFSIDDFFKTLMHDTYTPAIPIPQPVPPAPTDFYGTPFPQQSQQQPPYDQFNQYQPYSNDGNNFNNSIQPPLPPSYDNNQRNVSNDEYNPDSWEMDMSWNTTQDSSFNQTMDAPHSPPHYERKGVNTNVIEYIEPSADESHLTGSGDVDHRQLILPMNGLNALGAKDRGRLIDVDHRNLISLTGSPKLSEKDAGNESHTEGNNLSVSFDSKLLPPPSPPAILLSTNIDTTDTGKSMNAPLLPTPRFQSPPMQKNAKVNRSPAKSLNGRDNTESIDMEMSDEDAGPEFGDGEDAQVSNISSKSDSLLGPPSNIFASPEPAKRPNPFRTNQSQDLMHQMQQPQMLLHPNLPMQRSGPRPLLDLPANFNNAPYINHPNPMGTDIPPGNNHNNPFLLENPRGMNPQAHSPQMNYRNNAPIRGNSPYFRGQKGGPMRGVGFRPNFRGGMRGSW